MLVAQGIRHSKTLAEVVNEKKEHDEKKAISNATTACCVAVGRKHKQKKLEIRTRNVRGCERIPLSCRALRCHPDPERSEESERDGRE
jgi:hypothetical protein